MSAPRTSAAGPAGTGDLARARRTCTFALLAAVGGALVLVTTPFGGFTERYLVGSVVGYRDVGLWIDSDWQAALLISPGVLLLVASAVAAFRCVTGNEGLSRGVLRLGFRLALVSTVVVAVAGLGLLAFFAWEEVSEYWLDWGFYGGLSGAGGCAYLLRRANRELPQRPPAAGARPASGSPSAEDAPARPVTGELPDVVDTVDDRPGRPNGNR